MKVSEWVTKEHTLKKDIQGVWNDLIKLDSRFIDREELKNELYQRQRLLEAMINSNIVGIQAKEKDKNIGIYLGYKEILELLEEGDEDETKV